MVEPFSIDESWLDVTGSIKLFGSGEKIANEIRERHKRELNLTVSIGVSFNKIFAKLGSDMKKPDAVTCIDRLSFKKTVWNLPVKALMGIGRSTGRKLSEVGIYTLGDLANTDVRVLKNMLGVVGEKLWICANGMDNSPVVNSALMPAQKSISKGITPESDILDVNALKEFLYYLSKDVHHSMLDMGVYAYSVSVELRDVNLKRQTISHKLTYPIKTSTDIVDVAMELVNENYDWKLPLRSVSVGVSDFRDREAPVQTSVFTDDERQNKRAVLEQRVDDIRRKYGDNSISRAVLLTKEMPDTISSFSAKNKAIKDNDEQ
jgi:DNA polymerase-4